ncbi:hypothetical protein QPL79_05885 [Ignisphaera sp. 4213-co]|uniref:Uncharacterized protein n=1 Tax=Ignisphaera cupida TaxID=3050454 RepID=A0ABD4Z7I6_9CREN|nr:hypothetical protein [Ignisphaera sp. 4213-co]MDK6028888.1 hypothetical protein [Ignisphaera sp. 4213-co]
MVYNLCTTLVVNNSMTINEVLKLWLTLCSNAGVAGGASIKSNDNI